ncbi:uncharacterized protein [Littorina saxatilis]|uniref:RING-type domain-containing protein n=1 Tax=Littorina saxatilis TaxID=31220 RepID=A0AAN9AIE4_9CAEN
MATTTRRPASTFSFDGETSCPRCDRLCLGASILPCGHVTCASCLRYLRHHKSPCPFCGKRIPASGEETDRLGKDLVLQDLVNEQLVTQGQRPCQVCRQRGAAFICQDCREMYCHVCSDAHKQMQVSSNHNQQILPHLLPKPLGLVSPHRAGETMSPQSGVMNTSLVGGPHTFRAEDFRTPRTERILRQREDVTRRLSGGSFHSSSSVVNLPYTHRGDKPKVDRLVLPDDPPDSEVISIRATDSLVNLPTHRTHNHHSPSPRLKPAKQQTRTTKHRHEWVNNQIRLLRESAASVGEVAEAAAQFSLVAHQLSQETRRKQAFLNEYAERLLNSDVREDGESQFYVRGLSSVDSKAEMRWEDLERRLNEVRRTSAKFNNVETLQTRFSKLMLTINKASRSSDPLTASPKRVFETQAVTDKDVHTPFITDVLTTQDGRLIMADAYNKMVKLATLVEPAIVTSCLRLESEPGCLALLRDGVLAVTAKRKTIFFVDVERRLGIRSQCNTARQYVGVTSTPDSDDALLVSCWQNGERAASVDVIRRDGSVLRTVTNGNSLTGLASPRQMCVTDGNVLVPDFEKQCVYRVELTTGNLVNVLTHKQLVKPIEVAADQHRNVYVVSCDNQCVLVRSPSGEWRRLLHGAEHGSRGCVKPFALCLTDSGIVVSWARLHSDNSVAYSLVIGYDFV